MCETTRDKKDGEQNRENVPFRVGFAGSCKSVGTDNIFQVFGFEPLPQGDIKEVFLHADYDCLLGRNNFSSKVSTYLTRKDHFNLKGVVVHICGYQDPLFRMAENIRIASLLFSPDCRLLIENSYYYANYGTSIKSLGIILRMIPEERQSSVGICLDTSHLHLGGYPLRTRNQVLFFLLKFHVEIGLERIKLVHLNDIDADHFGHHSSHLKNCSGKVFDINGFQTFVSFCYVYQIPVILERKERDESELDMFEFDPLFTREEFDQLLRDGEKVYLKGLLDLCHKQDVNTSQIPGADMKSPGGDMKSPGGDNTKDVATNQKPVADKKSPGADNTKDVSTKMSPGADKLSPVVSWSLLSSFLPSNIESYLTNPFLSVTEKKDLLTHPQAVCGNNPDVFNHVNLQTLFAMNTRILERFPMTMSGVIYRASLHTKSPPSLLCYVENKLVFCVDKTPAEFHKGCKTGNESKRNTRVEESLISDVTVNLKVRCVKLGDDKKRTVTTRCEVFCLKNLTNEQKLFLCFRAKVSSFIFWQVIFLLNQNGLVVSNHQICSQDTMQPIPLNEEEDIPRLAHATSMRKLLLDI